jgi:hypothetical protein
LSFVLQTPAIMARGTGGRIRPHERDTDNNAAIIGADIEVLLEEHSTSVQNTEVQHMSEVNQRNYWNRLGHIFEFLEERYPAYYAVGVRELTDADPDKFW